jgi:hypothetical protein
VFADFGGGLEAVHDRHVLPNVSKDPF